jgi:mono/diheme cytochrome c family protein
VEQNGRQPPTLFEDRITVFKLRALLEPHERVCTFCKASLPHDGLREGACAEGLARAKYGEVKKTGLMIAVALCSTGAVWLFGQQTSMTVRDGVYSAAQAERGKMNYAIYCRPCHSADLSGGSHGDDVAPALRVDNFAVNRGDLGNLYSYIRTSMPRDEPGTLSAVMAADILAYVLAENGFPAGPRDLPADPQVLKGIQIVGRRAP